MGAEVRTISGSECGGAGDVGVRVGRGGGEVDRADGVRAGDQCGAAGAVLLSRGSAEESEVRG